MTRKLLSGHRLNDFTPSSFKEYVKSLYLKRPSRKSPSVKLKVKKPDFSWGETPKGKLTVKVRRKPKFLTRSELEQIKVESGRPANEVFLTAKRLKIEVREG